jgi:anaerobic dimethyl sulfoxide reductase subunit B (iron-sulfur subunit)
MTQLGFYFDSLACSGCKACQAACKDKNNLPVGLLWRRVYEVTGGGWQQSGATWTSDVFAYNLSLSCNHCAQPICVEVCPTQAMQQRADGIVVVDEDRCVGCQYCSWACPYDAPQYDRAHGHMTKCDFCVDNLEVGLPPTCVAACPLRVLDFGEVNALEAKQGSLLSVRPLPDESLTQPALIIKPHQAAQREAVLGNVEEVRPPHTSERSLIAFTLLAQTAVGAWWIAGALFIVIAWQSGAYVAETLIAPVLASCVLIMCAALAVSLFHLGTPQTAWRALSNVRSSWLSREILSTLAFGLTSTLAGVAVWFRLGPSPLRVVLALGAALFGVMLIVSMFSVYRLRTVDAWKTWFTSASFFITAGLLGLLAAGVVLIVTLDNMPPGQLFVFETRYDFLAAMVFRLIGISTLVLLSMRLVLMNRWRLIVAKSTGISVNAAASPSQHRSIFRLYLALAAISLSVAGLLTLADERTMIIGLMSIASISIAGAEIVGRWLFYEARTWGSAWR